MAEAGLSGIENRDLATLSGGQRARVSLVRTLLRHRRRCSPMNPFRNSFPTRSMSFAASCSTGRCQAASGSVVY
ncbi:hypothetical protein [Mesorhizobium sp. ANAO-SY3R2]|uniref:hypothetical protein n=1 Tax=Mesorhizobium sp. ANAO-SY3R2 TaxID=3166644 RepID=UPI00366EA1EE